MQTDFLQYIFQAINNLLTQNLGFFDAMGQNLFRSFATILIAWFGIKSALASASGRCRRARRQTRWGAEQTIQSTFDRGGERATTSTRPRQRENRRA